MFNFFIDYENKNEYNPKNTFLKKEYDEFYNGELEEEYGYKFQKYRKRDEF